MINTMAKTFMIAARTDMTPAADRLKVYDVQPRKTCFPPFRRARWINPKDL
jgi:hypothetical protein